MTESEFQAAVRQYPRIHIWRRNEYGRRRRGTGYVVGFTIGPRGGHIANIVTFGLHWRHLAEQSEPGRLIFNLTRRPSRDMMNLIAEGGLANRPPRRRRRRNRFSLEYR